MLRAKGTRKSYQFNSLAKWMKIYFIFFLTLTSFSKRSLFELTFLFLLLSFQHSCHFTSTFFISPSCSSYNGVEIQWRWMRIARKQRIVAQGKLSCLSDVSVRCWMFFVPRGRRSGWKFRVKWWIHLSKHEKNNGFRIYSISNFFLCSSSHSFKLWTFFLAFLRFLTPHIALFGFLNIQLTFFCRKSLTVYFVRIHIQKCRKNVFYYFLQLQNSSPSFNSAQQIMSENSTFIRCSFNRIWFECRISSSYCNLSKNAKKVGEKKAKKSHAKRLRQ